MRLKKFAYHCAAVVCAVTVVSCDFIDEEYRLDDVSKEISLGTGTTTLPLGSFEKRYLGDLLGSELDGVLDKTEDGSYSFSMVQAPESVGLGDFNLDELKSFTFDRMASEFDVELPGVSFDAPAIKVDAQTAIDTDIAPVQDFLNTLNTFSQLTGVSVNTTEGTIPEDLSLLQTVWPEFAWPSFATSYEETYNDRFTFEVPEQIAGVDKIYFEDIDPGSAGAPFHLSIDLNGLAGISNGGQVNIALSMPEGVLFKIDKRSEAVNSYSEEIDVAPGQENINFDIYFEYIDTSAIAIVDNKFDMELGMTCEIGFEFGTKAGYYNLNQKPTIELNSEFKLEDAAVKFAADASIMDFKLEEAFDIAIPNLPEQIKSINRIELTDNTALNLFINGFDALKDSGEYISIDMELPEFLDLEAPADAPYTYNAESHTLTTTLAAISEGLAIDFDAIDFGEGLAPVNGEVVLTYQPQIKVYFNQQQAVNIMSFLPMDEATGEPISNLHIEAGLDKTVVGLESVSANIDLGDFGNINEEVSLEDLQEFNELPINIAGSGLSPVLIIEIENPITLAPAIHASIAPVSNGVRDEENAFVIDAEIKAAQYVGGVVVPSTTKLVLAKSHHEAEYPAEEGYTFMAFDKIENLIKTPIPEYIDVSASVSLPNDGLVELHLSDSLDIKFGYSVEVPFAFDNTLSLSYEDTIAVKDENGESPFEAITSLNASNGLKVGDLALILDIETNLPLELKATTKLLGDNGEELATKLGFGEENNKVAGSKDGVTPEVSTLRLEFDLASGSLSELADINSILLQVAASSAAEVGAVALKDDQYIAATIKLEIDGGVTIDLGKLKNKVEDKLEELE